NVVGTCTTSTPRWYTAAANPAVSPTTPPPSATTASARSRPDDAKWRHSVSTVVSDFSSSPSPIVTVSHATPTPPRASATVSPYNAATAGCVTTTTRRRPRSTRATSRRTPLPTTVSEAVTGPSRGTRAAPRRRPRRGCGPRCRRPRRPRPRTRTRAAARAVRAWPSPPAAVAAEPPGPRAAGGRRRDRRARSGPRAAPAATRRARRARAGDGSSRRPRHRRRTRSPRGRATRTRPRARGSRARGSAPRRASRTTSGRACARSSRRARPCRRRAGRARSRSDARRSTSRHPSTRSARGAGHARCSRLARSGLAQRRQVPAVVAEQLVERVATELPHRLVREHERDHRLGDDTRRGHRGHVGALLEGHRLGLRLGVDRAQHRTVQRRERLHRDPGDEQLPGGHPALRATRAVRRAPVLARVRVPQDLVVRLAAGQTGHREPVADLDALHRLDAHERLREEPVDLAVPVDVRPETGRHAVAEHLHHATERVTDLRGRLHRGHHLVLGLRVEAPHGRVVDALEVVRRRAGLARCAHRAELDHVAEDRRAELREQGLRERTGRDARRGLARARALEHVARVVEPVLLHADEIRMARP